MRKTLPFLLLLSLSQVALSQDLMTPERLWQLGRITAPRLTSDGNNIVYDVSIPNITENKSSTKKYLLPIGGGQPQEITSGETYLTNNRISPDGKYKINIQDVKIQKVSGTDFYPELAKSNVQIYESLNIRHWDAWEDGAFSHLVISASDGSGEPKDIMAEEPYDCPQKPFGGDEDFTWSPDSKQIIYVTKKKSGTDYAVSTNTDIYAYAIGSGLTTNISEGLMGYDTHPAFSGQGVLAWLSMKRDGYESDKNDIVTKVGSSILNLTQHWDGTVNSFVWSNDSKKIYFTAALSGTIQLFEVDYPGLTKKMPAIKQITNGDFDINTIVGQAGNTLVVSRTDMNHASELYGVNLTSGQQSQLTYVNDAVYNKLKLSRIEKRFVTTTDNKQMPVWIIYPPDFDATKKYPTLLYCQGGPQSALTQFYSFRWNFQLMAANGYIIVAPDRRGMPGLGVAWNEQISKDWGGQVMQDYLSAIDNVAQENFVDKTRLGCVGASYGGYSVFYLAGIHQNRFKTFIAHDGVFNMKSMYGTTEELWFVNWDMGGPYWNNNAATQKSYADFDPSSKVDHWNTPILIFQGGKDFRVPIGQGLEAFTAAQLRGIKSKLVYLPEENHWVSSPQNALVWQHEFFRWLKETL
ncbi:MAG: S9 family peptidase [Cyclobacteriaceae bacterium]|nr:S9 family peptidase [Cyclobacteriaceae bacterium]MDH4297023.1 S9 family peptidase [Cyclobacteriaceae bacterium]MDH5250481.1 S9 family peptidase [Cyclobacteriaceae bacterium]